MYFVPFSVDSSHFRLQAGDSAVTSSAAELRKECGWARDDIVLLYLCQHTWVKAPDVMLGAVSQLQRAGVRAKLLVVGRGDMTCHMKERATEELNAGSWFFAGYVPSKKTSVYYRAADLALFPSRYDTWSRGVNEAMLSGRSCVASAVVGAAGGLIRDGINGFVVDELSEDAFAAGIRRFIDSGRARREELEHCAVEDALRFSYEHNLGSAVASLCDAASRSDEGRAP